MKDTFIIMVLCVAFKKKKVFPFPIFHQAIYVNGECIRCEEDATVFFMSKHTCLLSNINRKMARSNIKKKEKMS